MSETRTKDNGFSWKAKALLPPALWVVCILFIFGPSTIYFGNSSEFTSDFGSLFSYYCIVAPLVFVVVFGTGLLLPARSLSVYSGLIFALAFMLWMQGNLLVWDYGVFDGQSIHWRNYPWRRTIDLFLWFTVIAAALAFHRRLVKLSSVASLGMILAQSVFVISLYMAKAPTVPSESETTKRRSEGILRYSSSANIIHVLMDGMQTDVFEEVVRENGWEDELDGFVVFRENLAAYATTDRSYFAIFGGERYHGAAKLKDFSEELWAGRAFTNILYDHGYVVNVISGLRMPFKKYTNLYRIPKIYRSARPNDALSEAAFLLDIVLFRHLPQPLKKAIYNNQQWRVFPGLFGKEKAKAGFFNQKEFFQHYIGRLYLGTSAPAYHFVHLLPPHPPYVTNEDCSYAYGVLPATRENYKVESMCVTELFVQFLHKLKALGIYDSSFIILHADHGAGYPVKGLTGSSDESMSRTIGRSLALLAIKPAKQRGILRTSNAKTTVADIPPTVLKAAGRKSRYEGVSALQVEAGRRRFYNNLFVNTGSAYVLSSWKRLDEADSNLQVGRKEYRWGDIIEFGFLGNGLSYQKVGWGGGEDDYTWTVGQRAELDIPIADLPASDVILHADLMPMLYEGKLERQTVSISVNGKKAGEWLVTEKGFQQKTLLIPAALVSDPARLVIQLDMPDATSPRELGIGADERDLGVAVATLRLEPN